MPPKHARVLMFLMMRLAISMVFIKAVEWGSGMQYFDEEILTKPQRTYKREIACINLLIWWGIVVVSCYGVFVFEARVIHQLLDILAIITLPVWGFVLAAFGLDWHGKQSRWGMHERREKPKYYPHPDQPELESM